MTDFWQDFSLLFFSMLRGFPALFLCLVEKFQNEFSDSVSSRMAESSKSSKRYELPNTINICLERIYKINNNKKNKNHKSIVLHFIPNSPVFLSLFFSEESWWKWSKLDAFGGKKKWNVFFFFVFFFVFTKKKIPENIYQYYIIIIFFIPYQRCLVKLLWEMFAWFPNRISHRCIWEFVFMALEKQCRCVTVPEVGQRGKKSWRLARKVTLVSVWSVSAGCNDWCSFFFFFAISFSCAWHAGGCIKAGCLRTSFSRRSWLLCLHIATCRMLLKCEFVSLWPSCNLSFVWFSESCQGGQITNPWARKRKLSGLPGNRPS